MESISYIKKDQTIQIKNRGSYKVVSHDNVTAMIRDHFIKNGVYPIVTTEEFEQISESRCRVKVKITFVNVDDKPDSFSVFANAYGEDYADKAPGKALSLATKMIYLKALMLESGDAEESRFENKIKPKKLDINIAIDSLNKANNIQSVEKIEERLVSYEWNEEEKKKLNEIEELAIKRITENKKD